MRVSGGGVILERIEPVGILNRNARDGGVTRATDRGAVGISGGGLEAPAEPAPRNSFGVQEVADVLACHMDQLGFGGADFAERVDIIEERVSSVPILDHGTLSIGVVYHTVRLPGDEIEGAQR